jgi:hypothetical protein
MDPICPAQSRADPSLDAPAEGPPPTAGPDLEHRLRAAAHALLDALASGVSTTPQNCWDFSDGEKHDFDRCVIDRIPNPVPFLKKGDEVDAVSPTDVRQNRIGDCALMATLLALANTSKGRTLIENSIAENKDEKGQVASYTVTLRERNWHFLRPVTVEPVKVTVDATFAIGHALGGTNGKSFEVWTLVIESAVAKYMGGYNILHKGQYSSTMMRLLTGERASHIGLASYSSAQLTSDLAAGKLVVVESRQRFSGNNAYGVSCSHAYSVAGTVTCGGRLCVLLSNPWGPEHAPISAIPYDELHEWFGSVNVGSVK